MFDICGQYTTQMRNLEMVRCSTLEHQSFSIQYLFMTMEPGALKNVNNGLNTNIYSYLETSGGQSSNLYLNVGSLFDVSVNQTSVAI